MKYSNSPNGGDTFGWISGPDTAPPYAACFIAADNWGVMHKGRGEIILARLTEYQALKLSRALNETERDGQ